jgi:1-acyl-sn-glycerol-3-phosphate acyltransferase
MAVQSGVPVLPVTCNGPSKILPRGAKFVSPGHVRITIGEPIETTGMTEQDIASLMEKTRAEISKHLDLNYNPFNTPHIPESYDQGTLSA